MFLIDRSKHFSSDFITNFVAVFYPNSKLYKKTFKICKKENTILEFHGGSGQVEW